MIFYIFIITSNIRISISYSNINWNEQIFELFEYGPTTSCITSVSCLTHYLHGHLLLVITICFHSNCTCFIRGLRNIIWLLNEELAKRHMWSSSTLPSPHPSPPPPIFPHPLTGSATVKNNHVDKPYFLLSCLWRRARRHVLCDDTGQHVAGGTWHLRSPGRPPRRGLQCGRQWGTQANPHR